MNYTTNVVPSEVLIDKLLANHDLPDRGRESNIRAIAKTPHLVSLTISCKGASDADIQWAKVTTAVAVHELVLSINTLVFANQALIEAREAASIGALKAESPDIHFLNYQKDLILLYKSPDIEVDDFNYNLYIRGVGARVSDFERSFNEGFSRKTLNTAVFEKLQSFSMAELEAYTIEEGLSEPLRLLVKGYIDLELRLYADSYAGPGGNLVSSSRLQAQRVELHSFLGLRLSKRYRATKR